MLFPVFTEFEKIARLSREIVVTEKIDGTNAQILITEDGRIYAGSRNRWVCPADDNYSFAKWVVEHSTELIEGLGPGRHFGEWWGSGINRGYGLTKGEKRFSLFNVSRWVKPRTDGPTPALEGQRPCPACCDVVPTLYVGPFDTNNIDNIIYRLRTCGSFAAPGFKNPEGIVIFHTAARKCFKKTLLNDESPKSLAQAA